MPPLASRAPERGDLTLAGAVTGISLAALLLLPALARTDSEVALAAPGPSAWAWWAGVAIVLAQGARLAWLSAAPGRALVTVGALALLGALLPLGDLASIPLIAVIAASYAARRRDPDAPWLPWLITGGLVAVAATVINVRADAGPVTAVAAALGQAVLVVAVPAGIAAAVEARAQIRSSREREALARANELEARAEAAIAAERTAIARELHDIAAHHLSGIALMSSAISQQIDSDPPAAKAALADVRAQTRTLLDELRGLVALLRQDEGAAMDVESLAGLEALVATAAARGSDVRLELAPGATVRDLAEGIGPLGQFAAYRTVQEALANAARHAPGGRCSVQLHDAGDALQVVVANGPGTVPASAHEASGGFGLRGMRERASLTRSTLTYGPTEDGGWRVTLRIPRDASATAEAPTEAPTEGTA